jgi:thiol peroxidase (atypical 2-Cys peroxiredoxin) (EC 1.11.1.5)
MAIERKGVVTLQGNGLTLLGPEIKIGQKAPEFQVLTNDLKIACLSDFKGKIKLISVVPSLDTPVCDLQTKRFNEEALGLSSDVIIFNHQHGLAFCPEKILQRQQD